MRFAVITDIHIGKYQTHKFIFRKNTLYSKKLLRKFVKKMNKSYKPDFIVQCGDMIEDINRTKDEKNYKTGVKILSKLKCRVYHVIGNHDQRNLQLDFILDRIDRTKPYYKIDRDECRLIFLFTRQKFSEDGSLLEPHLGSGQIDWLKSAVNTDKKIFIFSHASLVPFDTRGNFWFSNKPQETYISDYKEFLTVIKNKNIKLIVNGHLHWNKVNLHEGIPCITIQSLVENTSGKIKGSPANAYALFNITDNQVKVDIKGMGGLEYSVEF